MIKIGSVEFKEVWIADFEFMVSPGDRSVPVCLVAKELSSGQTIRLWQDELKRLKVPPFSIDNRTLFVAYFASAEFSCFLALGWQLPSNVLDPFVEFRNSTNGYQLPAGKGLLGALTYYGLNGIDAMEKKDMRDMVLRGGPWSRNERKEILKYCESDVIALEMLLDKMEPTLDMPFALLRGRYMKSVAKIEFNGVPVNLTEFQTLQNYWTDIQDQLISEIDADYGVFDGRVFKVDRFKKWLIDNNIPWPTHPSGNLNLQDNTFKGMAKVYPVLGPLRELRASLSKMRLSELAIGPDGRNRCLLSPFRSKTGRNQPSTTKFIFGPAIWLRGLIKPEPGYGLAYIDYEQQEFGIAGALSKDPLMLKAYNSGDPYLGFAKQVGAVPKEATKESHQDVREQFKTCALGVQYGMGAESLAILIKKSKLVARDLIRLHKQTYKIFWEWSDNAVSYAMLHGKLFTTFGWNIHMNETANLRSLINFPMQANGAEMLRIACCLATEQDIGVCAPIHDAILIEAPLDKLNETIDKTQQIMAEASEIVLDGFMLRTEAKVIRYPDRYEDERGRRMREKVCNIIHNLKKFPADG